MGLIVTGLVINLIVCFGVLGQTEGPNAMPIGFFYGAIVFWAVSVIGLVLVLTGKRKLGSVLVIIGSIAFVPIGLIAVIGARKVTDKNLGADLAARRQAATKTAEPPADAAR